MAEQLQDHPLELLSCLQLSAAKALLRYRAPSLAGALQPGQFLNLKIPGYLLRRPMAPASQEGESLELLVFSRGPATLELMGGRREVMALGPLGRPFPLPPPGAGPALLVSGGSGAAPLLFLAARLRAIGVPVLARHGSRDGSEFSLAQRFASLGCSAEYFSEDGSAGTQDRPTDRLPELSGVSCAYAVGPRPLMHQVASACQRAGVPAWISLEEPMACGVGACLSCAVQTAQGQRHACVDGPVFPAAEVVW